MKDKNKDKDVLRITQQCRARGGMVYDLKCESARLTVRVFPRESDADSGEWRVEASPSHTAEAVIITEWGATRAETLREVGRSWTSKAAQYGLPTFDWDAVAQVLTDVRAL
jgi:hypothetical protein